MTLSPTERVELRRELLAEIRQEVGGSLSSLVVLPVSAAASLIGLSPAQVRRKLPLTRLCAGKHGVTLSNVQAYIEANTLSRLPD